MKTESSINRRIFLKHSAALTAGGLTFPYFVSPTALGKSGAVAPSNRITVGCIGVGSHGTAVDLRGFLAQPDAQVLSVCDVDSNYRNRAREITNQKYNNKDCSAYNDFRDIIARNDIDAVMIATPDHWHVPMSLAAVKAGKDVCCEKPTLTVREGRILSDAVKRYSRVFQTSTEDRSIAIYHRMAELVRNGRIGKLKTIKVTLPAGHSIHGPYKDPKNQKPQPIPNGFDYEMWLGPAPYAPYTPARCHWNFRWILDYSGGMITDWGTHLLDTAQWANDTERTGPVEVQGKGEFPTVGIYNTATKYHIEYKYANGVTLIVDSGGSGIRCEGTEGWIESPSWRRPLQAEPKSILDSKIEPDEIRLFTCPAGEHRNFLDCVKSRQDPYFPAEIGHRCSSLCHLGNIAMMLKRKLKWDPARETFPKDDQANRMLARPSRSPWSSYFS